LPNTDPDTTSRPHLVLASASPRRADLLRDHGFKTRIVKPPREEPDLAEGNLSPPEMAKALSYFKARAVAELVDTGLIVAGDTIVALGGKCFGKPTDRRHAREILLALSGTTQQVITGVTLLDAASRRRLIRHDVTDVTMRKMLGDEMEAYLDSGDWAGKAGAYGIQDSGDAFVTRVRGSFTNVVGMPMELLERMLGEWQTGS